MKTVLIAGATGYLGRHLCAEYERRGWYVVALVRDAARAGDLPADNLVEAQATQPETLRGIMSGVGLVVSALGITRPADGLGYMDVDYQANVNLLEEAERAGVSRFAYAHVLNADKMQSVPMVAAKSAFVDRLRASPLAGTIIAPSGYFSDMGDFLSMARSGRVWLFAPGTHRINPIHGSDLATAAADAIDAGLDWLDVGGPDTFTHDQIAALAFDAFGRAPRVLHLPDVLQRAALTLVPVITPRRINGPARFFLTAMGMDMVGAVRGSQHLADHFAEVAKTDTQTALDT